MSGSNSLEFISYYLKDYGEYSDDKLTIHGAYGPRLFDKDGIDQFSYVLERLKSNPNTRKAVIQLFDADDLAEEHSDVPCTCTLQFVSRSSKLHMHVNMRSNDAFTGLPHDVFSFTMIQEFMARILGLAPGHYYHTVGSLHLYTKDFPKVERFLSEGIQDDVPMPPMPESDPVAGLSALKEAEKVIRTTRNIPLFAPEIPAYWQDLIRLLAIFSSSSPRDIVKIKNNMCSKTYEGFIRKRHMQRIRTTDLPLFDKVREDLNAGTSS
jgi:thymidylate synthase